MHGKGIMCLSVCLSEAARCCYVKPFTLKKSYPICKTFVLLCSQYICSVMSMIHGKSFCTGLNKGLGSVGQQTFCVHEIILQFFPIPPHSTDALSIPIPLSCTLGTHGPHRRLGTGEGRGLGVGCCRMSPRWTCGWRYR